MAKKSALLPFIILGLFAILACGRFSQVLNEEPKTPGEPSRSFTLDGKEWSSFDLDQTDIHVELPGEPSDKSPEMLRSHKTEFSAMRIYSYDDKDFASSYTQLEPAGKRRIQIKEMADTSMASLKRQLPDLTYTLDIQSDTNAKYSGTFTRNGKSFLVRGCCVYKKAEPRRVWAVLTLFPEDNSDARDAGQRIIDSVVFDGSSEECK